MLIGHPEDVRRLSVYQYHFLDDLSFVRKPGEVFEESKQTDLDAYIDKVRQHFKDAGWEGDGQIGIIWLPPFVHLSMPVVSRTHGVLISGMSNNRTMARRGWLLTRLLISTGWVSKTRGGRQILTSERALCLLLASD